MSSNQVVFGNQLCFDQFEGVESHFRTILNLVKKAGLYEVLNADTRVYSNKLKEFYINGSCDDGEIKTRVRDIIIT